MSMDIALIIFGIALLLVSGEVIVKYASLFADSLGISTLVVGLTVVAFGTSTPELAVNILAALRGSGGVSFGNIVGSNIANIGLVVGISAILTTLHIEAAIVKKEMPRMLFVTAAFTALVLLGGQHVIGRVDGAILLVLFGTYLYLMYKEATKGEKHPAENSAVRHKKEALGQRAALYVFLTFAGLAGLWAGGSITVEAAVSLARRLDISDAVIGLSVVAVGTSLPELVVSVNATLKGNTSLAIGNIVGSNIFNLLLVAGASSFISPFGIPGGGILDLMVMVAFSLILILFAWTHNFRIKRWEGGLLLAAYVSYIVLRVCCV